MFIDQWLLPRAKPIHDPHLFLCLGGEACNFLALNNRLTTDGVKKPSKDGWAMAALPSSATTQIRARGWKMKTHTAETTPPFFQTFAAIFLRLLAWG